MRKKVHDFSHKTEAIKSQRKNQKEQIIIIIIILIIIKRRKNDTKMKHPQIITYKKTMGEAFLGGLTPLAKSIKH